MNDITNKGQVLSIFVYIAYGLMLLISMFVLAPGFNTIAIAMLFFWGVTSAVMIAIRLSDLRHSMAYKMLYIMSACILATLGQIYMHASYMLLLEFGVLWLTTITFLDKSCFRALVALQLMCILFLFIVPHEVSGMEEFSIPGFAFCFIGLLIADWIGQIIINILIQYDEETQEYERSLDDLLDVIEAQSGNDGGKR